MKKKEYTCPDFFSKFSLEDVLLGSGGPFTEETQGDIFD